MEQNNSKIWIAIGVIAAIILIYFGITGSGKLVAPSEKNNSDANGNGTTIPQKSEAELKMEELVSKKLNAIPGSPEAPKQSNPISKESASKEAIKISVSSSGFLPAVFTVNSGTPVTLAITSADAKTHVFKFDSSALSGIAVGIGPNETREIPFITPARGEYAFYCDVPGHKGRGEAGTMVVQ
ncbi:MAG: cupredoxin domain-containing protein [Patescibacteria group bacterium]